MQIRLNSDPIEDPVSDQVLRDDNKSAKGSSCRTILEAPQGSARDDTLPIGEGVQLLGGQEAPKNPGAMGAGDLMEVNALPDNEKSSREDEIATEIEQLKKEQKKLR